MAADLLFVCRIDNYGCCSTHFVRRLLNRHVLLRDDIGLVYFVVDVISFFLRAKSPPGARWRFVPAEDLRGPYCELVCLRFRPTILRWAELVRVLIPALLNMLACFSPLEHEVRHWRWLERRHYTPPELKAVRLALFLMLVELRAME